MTEQEFREILQELLYDTFRDEDEDEDDRPFPKSTKSFNEAGLMTHNEGIVVKMSDGSEFQLTIVQSR